MAGIKGKVLIAAPIHEILESGLIGIGYELLFKLDISQETANEIVADVVGIVTSTRLQLTKELIDSAPELKWIARMGSGMEVIDVEYAMRRQINCFSSPEGNANAVAEHALGMLLALTKKIVEGNIEIKDGKWLREKNRGIELEKKTIGIIGFGHTGQAFAKKLLGFDMKILVYDKYELGLSDDKYTFCDDLNPIYEHADIISFHVPLRDDTHHYLDMQFLSKLKKNIILVNTSRGNIVDTDALVAGIKSKKIWGACLDVFEQEPIDKMSSDIRQKFMHIAKLENVVITPHIAGYSIEALYKMSKILLDHIVTYV